jgi:transcriptional regulator with XRE-family HTH domain
MAQQTPDQVLDRLRAWCQEKRGRNMEIAQKLGVSKQLVTDWLKGRAVPTWENGAKIAEFLKKQRRRRAA